jgi:CheY-like chemotaxis protein
LLCFIWYTTKNGWEVQAARDGGEALETSREPFLAAMLVDIEMPRMDGYELITTLRDRKSIDTCC